MVMPHGLCGGFFYPTASGRAGPPKPALRRNYLISQVFVWGWRRRGLANFIELCSSMIYSLMSSGGERTRVLTELIEAEGGSV